MEELNVEFNDYVNEFKKLDYDLKLKEITNSIKELATFIDVLAATEGINLNYLKSGEILDLKKFDVTYDDYLEAILVYIEVSKNLLGEYLEAKSINDGNPII